MKHPHVLQGVLVLAVVWQVGAQLVNLASPRVELADGKVRGKYVLSREGRKVRAFLGIPYAKPPVAELRFKSAEPPTPWSHERWTVDHPKPCVQPEKRHGKPVGKEDCLYLNVYTPESTIKPQVNNSLSKKKTATAGNVTSNDIPLTTTTTTTTTTPPPTVSPAAKSANGTWDLPVMVFFHGGGFEMGHSEPFTHEYLLETNVVVVVVQYRLGFLGFLSTGDEVLPGNLGLKDQRLALKWVQANIKNFGGSPERVTIFGDEAGGASVHYHMLFTPPKNGMFRGGMSMSGTALSPWAFRPPAEVKHMVDRVAHLTNCPKESQEFVDCLREKPAEQFVELLHKYKNETRSGCGEWAMALPMLGAVLENSTNEDAFITASPWDKRVSLPWVVGVTSKEMLYEFTPQLVDRRDKGFEGLDKCFNETLPEILGYKFSNASESGLVAAVRSFYFKNKPITRNMLSDIVDAVSDGSVIYPVFESIRRAGRRSTWLYNFNFLGSNTYGASALDGRVGPGRGDDLFLFFPRPLGKNVPRKNKKPDADMSKKLITLWTNFATDLDPTQTDLDGLKWIPVAPSTTFLNIGQEKLVVERPFLDHRMNFWSMQAYPRRDDMFGDAATKAVPEPPGEKPPVKRAPWVVRDR